MSKSYGGAEFVTCEKYTENSSSRLFEPSLVHGAVYDLWLLVNRKGIEAAKVPVKLMSLKSIGGLSIVRYNLLDEDLQELQPVEDDFVDGYLTENEWLTVNGVRPSQGYFKEDDSPWNVCLIEIVNELSVPV